MCIKIVKANNLEQCDSKEPQRTCSFHKEFTDVFVKFEGKRQKFHDKIVIPNTAIKKVQYKNRKYKLRLHPNYPIIYIEVKKPTNKMHPIFQDICQQYGLI